MACSSIGRASDFESEGRGFESLRALYRRTRISYANACKRDEGMGVWTYGGMGLTRVGFFRAKALRVGENAILRLYRQV